MTSTDHEGQARYWLAYVYGKLRRREEALQASRAAKRLGFGDLRVSWRLARLYLRTGNLYQAARHSRRVTRLLTALLRFRLRRAGGRAVRLATIWKRHDTPG